MALHCSADEFLTRQRRAAKELVAHGLGALLIFQQESLYYLTGYDSSAAALFRCLIFRQSGELTLLVSAGEHRQATCTSLVRDIRTYAAADAERLSALRVTLEALGLKGARIGIETAGHGLTYQGGLALTRSLDGFCTLELVGHLVDRLRAVKSEAELAYVRQAAKLADDALEAGLRGIAPGVSEAHVLAEMQSAVLAGGGDYPARAFVIGSARDALLRHYRTGRGELTENDQLALEFAGVFCHYHVLLARTVLIGRLRPEHARMHAACREALAACESVLRPGCTAGDVFAQHAQVVGRHGMTGARGDLCGYGLGAHFWPTWIDAPLCRRENPAPLLPGMVMYVFIALLDAPTASAVTLGRSYILTSGAPEPLSRVSLDLLLR